MSFQSPFECVKWMSDER